jgi:adenine phosphoribosyltransferase
VLFRDITPLLADPAALRTALELHRHAVADLADRVDRVVAVESRGFLFGMALAERMGAGFCPVRKPGKLPAATIQENYTLEYGMDSLQIHVDALAAGHRVLVVDDLLATGGTAGAACRLVERLGGQVLACLFLVELRGLSGRVRLEGRRVEAILAFD